MITLIIVKAISKTTIRHVKHIRYMIDSYGLIYYFVSFDKDLQICKYRELQMVKYFIYRCMSNPNKSSDTSVKLNL